jgi:hypothetical protein
MGCPSWLHGDIVGIACYMRESLNDISHGIVLVRRDRVRDSFDATEFDTLGAL